MNIGGTELLNVTANVADVTSGWFGAPSDAKGMLLAFERLSADPGAACGFQLEVEMPISPTNIRKLYKSASFDLDTVDYFGYLVSPFGGLLAAYNSAAPIAVSAVVLAHIPRVFRVFVDRATAQSTDFRLSAHWLR